MAKEKQIPEGNGAAAPGKGATVYAKKDEKYISFVGRCRKAGKSMAECAKIWKAGQEGEKTSPKGSRRRRAARILRKKKKVAGYGPAA